MIYGDQWTCACGWANVFVRNKCRNCGAYKPENAEITPAMTVIQNVSERSILAGEAEIPDHLRRVKQDVAHEQDHH